MVDALVHSQDRLMHTVVYVRVSQSQCERGRTGVEENKVVAHGCVAFLPFLVASVSFLSCVSCVVVCHSAHQSLGT